MAITLVEALYDKKSKEHSDRKKYCFFDSFDAIIKEGHKYAGACTRNEKKYLPFKNCDFPMFSILRSN